MTMKSKVQKRNSLDPGGHCRPINSDQRNHETCGSATDRGRNDQIGRRALHSGSWLYGNSFYGLVPFSEDY